MLIKLNEKICVDPSTIRYTEICEKLDMTDTINPEFILRFLTYSEDNFFQAGFYCIDEAEEAMKKIIDNCE